MIKKMRMWHSRFMKQKGKSFEIVNRVVSIQKYEINYTILSLANFRFAKVPLKLIENNTRAWLSNNDMFLLREFHFANCNQHLITYIYLYILRSFRIKDRER